MPPFAQPHVSAAPIIQLPRHHMICLRRDAVIAARTLIFGIRRIHLPHRPLPASAMFGAQPTARSHDVKRLMRRLVWPPTAPTRLRHSSFCSLWAVFVQRTGYGMGMSYPDQQPLAASSERNPMALASVAIAALFLLAGIVLFVLGHRTPAAVLFWLGIIPLVLGLFGLLHANETWGNGKRLAGIGLGLSALSLVGGVLALVLPHPTVPVVTIGEVQVTGAAGAQPNVQFGLPFREAEQTTRLISAGTGAPLADGQQLTVQMAGWRGDTGELVSSTWDDGATENFTFGGVQFEFLTQALAGANVGAQLLWAVPTAELGDDGEPVTYLWLLEIEDAVTLPDRAEGAAVTPPEHLPVVTLAADGAPTIDIPADFEPTDELVVQTLIEGTGPEVQPNATVTVHYTGWLTDGTVFDSSWESGQTASFGLHQVIQGWGEGLVGQRVGSQVLLIVPPEYGYGPDDFGPIPGGSTLIFVVDILAAN